MQLSVRTCPLLPWDRSTTPPMQYRRFGRASPLTPPIFLARSCAPCCFGRKAVARQHFCFAWKAQLLRDTRTRWLCCSPRELDLDLLDCDSDGRPTMDQQRQEPAGAPDLERLVAAALDGAAQPRSGQGLQAEAPPARSLLDALHDCRVEVPPRSLRLCDNRQPLPLPNAETGVQGRAGPAPAE